MKKIKFSLTKANKVMEFIAHFLKAAYYLIEGFGIEL